MARSLLFLCAVALASAADTNAVPQQLEKSEPTKAAKPFYPFVYPWWDPKAASEAVATASKTVGEATNKAAEAVSANFA